MRAGVGGGGHHQPPLSPPPPSVPRHVGLQSAGRHEPSPGCRVLSPATVPLPQALHTDLRSEHGKKFKTSTELGLRQIFDFATSENATTYSINKDLCGTLKYEICLLLQVEIEVSIQYLAVITHATTCKRCQIVSIVVARAQL